MHFQCGLLALERFQRGAASGALSETLERRPGSDECGMLGRIHSKLVVEAVMQELLQRLPVSDETMVDNSASKGHDAALRLSFVPHIGSV